MTPSRETRRWFLAAVASVVVDVGGVEAEVIALSNLQRAIDGGTGTLDFRVGTAKWEFIRISPGEFLMGSVAGDPLTTQDHLQPAQLVRITRPFYLSKYQVTQSQYASVMTDDHRIKFTGDDLPVNDLTYRDALKFCQHFSSAIGVTVALPTEAQWEYACRAGTTTLYSNGNSVADLEQIAWFEDNSDRRVHAVGKKQPNAWGLYDMEGNLYEPCLDLVSVSLLKRSNIDPVGSRSPDRGIARGGAYLMPAGACRCSARIFTIDDLGDLGLRLAINPR